MNTWVAFLRGVNVNGITVKSAELKACLAAAGLHEVRTVLATGNAIFAAPGAAGPLKTAVEGALGTTFGYDAWIVLLTADDVRALVDRCPVQPRDGWHTYVVLVSDATVLSELVAAAADLDAETDVVQAGDGALYWQVAVGNSTNTPFAKTLSRPRYKSSTTSRNLKTMQKVIAAL